MENQNKLLPLYVVARRLHVPQKWLRAEAEAGKIPHLKAGKAILLNPVITENLLIQRMSKGVAVNA
jgi:hypothetical protein